MRPAARRLLAAGALAAALSGLCACGQAAPTDVPLTAPDNAVKPSAAAAVTANTPLDTLLASASDFGAGWSTTKDAPSDGPLIAHCAATKTGDVTAQATRSFTGTGQTVAETLSRYTAGPQQPLATFTTTPQTCTTVTASGATYTAVTLPPLAGLQSAGLHLTGTSGERVVYAGIVGDVLAVASVASPTAHGGALDAAAQSQFRVVAARAAGHAPDASAGQNEGAQPSGVLGDGVDPGAPAGPDNSTGSTGSSTLNNILGTNKNVESTGQGDPGPGNMVGPAVTGEGPTP